MSLATDIVTEREALHEQLDALAKRQVELCAAVKLGTPAATMFDLWKELRGELLGVTAALERLTRFEAAAARELAHAPEQLPWCAQFADWRSAAANDRAA